MGDESSTAQVHPELLTKTLIAAAVKLGAKVQQGIVDGVQLDSNKAVQGELLQTVMHNQLSRCAVPDQPHSSVYA